MQDVPEDRARTVGMCKRLGIWPLSTRHRERGPCACPDCFAGDSSALVGDELAKRRRVALPWEEDYEAA